MGENCQCDFSISQAPRALNRKNTVFMNQTRHEASVENVLSASITSFHHRFLAWKKINSMVKARTIPISRLGNDFAPCLKNLYPSRGPGQQIVDLKAYRNLDVDELAERNASKTLMRPSFTHCHANRLRQLTGSAKSRSGCSHDSNLMQEK